VAAFEIMVGTTAVGHLIRENATHQIPGILQTQAQEGMCTLDHSLSERYARGLISRAVALERAQDHRQLQNLLDNIDLKRSRSRGQAYTS
jgi:twitching motility protein PilT